jgi:hypothetical protein
LFLQIVAILTAFFVLLCVDAILLNSFKIRNIGRKLKRKKHTLQCKASGNKPLSIFIWFYFIYEVFLFLN